MTFTQWALLPVSVTDKNMDLQEMREVSARCRKGMADEYVSGAGTNSLRVIEPTTLIESDPYRTLPRPIIPA